MCKKLAYFLRNLQTSLVNNSKILRNKYAKFSVYYFDINTNIYGDFQIYTSVPLTQMRLIKQVLVTPLRQDHVTN